MGTVYLVSLIAGGIFVLLSLFGGGEADVDTDIDADMDLDADFDSDISSGPGFVDILSLRMVFLFLCFFGLSGTTLPLVGLPFWSVLTLSLVLGAFVGIAGSYAIKRIAYAHVSSEVNANDLQGMAGKVLIPFDALDKGKISLVAKGQRMQLTACAFEEAEEGYEVGDEVVIVHMNGRIAEVVKTS